jgi:Probable zinc-ribbon domain
MVNSPPIPIADDHVMRRSFTDKMLKCVVCGEEFVFSAGEQLFFNNKQFHNDPKRIERYATVMAQLHDEQGDRGVLLGERDRLIELGRRIGLRSFGADDIAEGSAKGMSIVDVKMNQNCFH